MVAYCRNRRLLMVVLSTTRNHDKAIAHTKILQKLFSFSFLKDFLLFFCPISLFLFYLLFLMEISAYLLCCRVFNNRQIVFYLYTDDLIDYVIYLLFGFFLFRNGYKAKDAHLISGHFNTNARTEMMSKVLW
jgi:hypothetical protein